MVLSPIRHMVGSRLRIGYKYQFGKFTVIFYIDQDFKYSMDPLMTRQQQRNLDSSRSMGIHQLKHKDSTGGKPSQMTELSSQRYTLAQMRANRMPGMLQGQGEIL